MALPEGLEALVECALPARKHGPVAQRVGAGFGFAKLLDQIEEVRRFVCLECNNKLLIVQAERVGGV